METGSTTTASATNIYIRNSTAARFASTYRPKNRPRLGGEHQTKNLGVRSSNLFGRAIFISIICIYRLLSYRKSKRLVSTGVARNYY